MRRSHQFAIGFVTLLLTPTLSAQRESVSTAPDAMGRDEVRAMVAEMLADAESRSSLLQSGSTAGHDGGFFLASPDGNFRLNVSGQIQFRYTANFRDDEPGMDDFETGFTLPRTALRFDGHVHDPNLRYVVQGAFDRGREDAGDTTGGDFELEDAYVYYTFDNGLTLIGGQYRLPILWEDMVFEKYSLAADQSVMNAVFGQGRSQAVAIHYQADQWRMWAAFGDGIRSTNTDLAQDPADWGLTSRWEWKLAGDWSQFNKFSSPRDADFGAKLGGGIHWEQSPDAPGLAVTDTLAWTGDVMLAGGGWNAFAAGVGLNTDTDGGGDFTDWGAVAQTGLFVTERIEPFARWSAIFADSDRSADDDFHAFTLGANCYLHGQAVKFTFDASWFPNDTAGNALTAGTAASERGRRIGLLPSGEDNQFAIRAQLQLLF